MRLTIFSLLLLFLSVGLSNAQIVADTTANVHSVRKATILSAIIPGGGQVYNKKIWKVPIVYGGLAFMAYFVKSNQDDYRKYNNALIKRYDADGTNEELTEISTENLRILSNNSNRNRDLCIAGAFIVYALNIIDAHVDAHLFSFNVDDDLSLQIQPDLRPFQFANNGFQAGINLAFHF
jgi:hypothetical protein